MKAFRATYTPREDGMPLPSKSRTVLVIEVAVMGCQFNVIFIDANGDLATGGIDRFSACQWEEH